VNSLNSLNSLGSMNSIGSRLRENKDGINNLEEYMVLTNNNKDTLSKVKEQNSVESVNLEISKVKEQNSVESVNLENHSRYSSSFLENDISAWRNRPKKEIEIVHQQDTNSNGNSDNNSNNNNTINYDLKVSDSISAWKIESSVSNFINKTLIKFYYIIIDKIK